MQRGICAIVAMSHLIILVGGLELFSSKCATSSLAAGVASTKCHRQCHLSSDRADLQSSSDGYFWEVMSSSLCARISVKVTEVPSVSVAEPFLLMASNAFDFLAEASPVCTATLCCPAKASSMLVAHDWGRNASVAYRCGGNRLNVAFGGKGRTILNTSIILLDGSLRLSSQVQIADRGVNGACLSFRNASRAVESVVDAQSMQALLLTNFTLSQSEVTIGSSERAPDEAPAASQLSYLCSPTIIQQSNIGERAFATDPFVIPADTFGTSAHAVGITAPSFFQSFNCSHPLSYLMAIPFPNGTLPSLQMSPLEYDPYDQFYYYRRHHTLTTAVADTLFPMSSSPSMPFRYLNTTTSDSGTVFHVNMEWSRNATIELLRSVVVGVSAPSLSSTLLESMTSMPVLTTVVLGAALDPQDIDATEVGQNLISGWEVAMTSESSSPQALEAVLNASFHPAATALTASMEVSLAAWNGSVSIRRGQCCAYGRSMSEKSSYNTTELSRDLIALLMESYSIASLDVDDFAHGGPQSLIVLVSEEPSRSPSLRSSCADLSVSTLFSLEAGSVIFKDNVQESTSVKIRIPMPSVNAWTTSGGALHSSVEGASYCQLSVDTQRGTLPPKPLYRAFLVFPFPMLWDRQVFAQRSSSLDAANTRILAALSGLTDGAAQRLQRTLDSNSSATSCPTSVDVLFDSACNCCRPLSSVECAVKYHTTVPMRSLFLNATQQCVAPASCGAAQSLDVIHNTCIDSNVAAPVATTSSPIVVTSASPNSSAQPNATATVDTNSSNATIALPRLPWMTLQWLAAVNTSTICGLHGTWNSSLWWCTCAAGWVTDPHQDVLNTSYSWCSTQAQFATPSPGSASANVSSTLQSFIETWSASMRSGQPGTVAVTVLLLIGMVAFLILLAVNCHRCICRATSQRHHRRRHHNRTRSARRHSRRREPTHCNDNNDHGGDESADSSTLRIEYHRCSDNRLPQQFDEGRRGSKASYSLRIPSSRRSRRGAHHVEEIDVDTTSTDDVRRSEYARELLRKFASRLRREDTNG